MEADERPLYGGISEAPAIVAAIVSPFLAVTAMWQISGYEATPLGVNPFSVNFRKNLPVSR